MEIARYFNAHVSKEKFASQNVLSNGGKRGYWIEFAFNDFSEAILIIILFADFF